MAAPSENSIESEFLAAVQKLNTTADPWPALESLASLRSSASIVRDPIQAQTAYDKVTQPADLTISSFETLAEHVSTAALLSSNEELEEIPTATLKYLLLPYLIAVAHTSWHGEPALRLQHLNRASEYLTSFFSSMDDLRLLSDIDRDRVLTERSDDVKLVLTPAQARDEKIERFKAEKAAQRRLDALFERLEKRPASEPDADDEDVERDAAQVILESGVRKALDLHRHTARELEVLRWAEKQRAKGGDPRQKSERARAGPVPPPVEGMPNSFRIVNEREQERQKVFRPSHSLPTYTVEEWGQIQAELIAKAEAEKKEQEVTAKRRKEDEDSDADEAVDQKTAEQRQWDNWKDEHNRGSGNTIR